MQPAFRTVSRVARRSSPLLQIVAPPETPLSRGNQIRTRLSSTGSKPAAKKTVKSEDYGPLKNKSSSVRPLPTPPPSPKGTPPTINTRDIEEYIQPLYSRGWGLSPILPNGNGIAVLRKRFYFASADALKKFLADLSEYEEKKQHHARTNVIEEQHAVLVSTWTHVARRSNADVKDKNAKTQGVTARDIRLAYALEKLFESALATGGREYDPHVRPEADRPQTIEELDGYS